KENNLDLSIEKGVPGLISDDNSKWVPERDEIERLCKLMTTARQQLDYTMTKSYMD
ncbi:8250_t:CDS:2, partial [Gigaspora margarita]